MYICICNAVTDQEIERVALEGARSLECLQDRLGVSSCCGQCAEPAQECLSRALDGIGAGSDRSAVAA